MSEHIMIFSVTVSGCAGRGVAHEVDAKFDYWTNFFLEQFNFICICCHDLKGKCGASARNKLEDNLSLFGVL